MKNRLLILFVLLGVGTFVYGQVEITEKLDFERVIEYLLPQQEIDVDYSDLYDRLFTLYSNPIDLNKAKRTDLQSLFFLSETQISGIIDYREKHGKFMTFYELLSIEGIDADIVERLIPFLNIDINSKESLLSSLSKPDNNEIFLRYQSILEQKKGYTPPDTLSSGKLTSRYAGGASQLYSRFLYSKKGYYSFGFTVEKDAGEEITWSPETNRYGMDYYSFHGMIENVSIFKRIVVGDFSMDFGQGLVFGSGLRLGKGIEPISTIRRNELGLRPYRSVYENKDFSGVAISAMAQNIEFNMFYSGLKRDAILQIDTIDVGDSHISSLQTIGLHRTVSEINSKHSTGDRSIGGNVNFASNDRKMEVGLNGIYTKYSVSIIPEQRIYNQFDFSGIDNYVVGGYANYYLRKAHVFGEFAISKSGGTAMAAGVIASLSSQVQTSLHIRNHDRDFHSFYAEAFGENTRVSNEKGIYWGLKVEPVHNLVLTGYMDFYSFPWLKYQVDAPSHGRDYMLSAIYTASEKVNFRVLYRNKTKEINFREDGDPIVSILPKDVERILLDINYDLGRGFAAKSRIQRSNVSFNDAKSSGFILAQDVNYSHEKFSISARYALFETDDYDNRQFIYERDMLYVYSIPFFYNQGVRYFVVMKYDIAKRISLWLKMAKTDYFNVDVIGSGLEEIYGNTRTNIGFQVRVRM